MVKTRSQRDQSESSPGTATNTTETTGTTRTTETTGTTGATESTAQSTEPTPTMPAPSAPIETPAVEPHPIQTPADELPPIQKPTVEPPLRVSPAASRAPSRQHSTASSKKRRELLAAKEELLRIQVELAQARIARLEADSEDEEEDAKTVEENMERTQAWVNVHRTTLAITAEPHRRIEAQTSPREVTLPSLLPRIENRSSRPPPSHYEPVQEVAERDAATTTRAREIDYVHSAGARETTAQVNNNVVHPSMHRDTHLNTNIMKRQQEEMPSSPNFIQERRANHDYRELAAAITLAARSAQPAIAPRPIPELPTFSGLSSEWLPFKSVYEESAVYLTEQENLSRLRRSLKGIAREAVQCLFVGSTTTDEVMNLLRARFGRPDALITAELEKLRSLPRLTETPRDICIFALKIINIVATIKALDKIHYLYNPEVVRCVVEKMPSALRYRYYDFAAEQLIEEPDLIKLAKFLERTADRCGAFAPAELNALNDRRERPTKAPVRSYVVEEHKSNATPTSRCCLCEKESHRPHECQIMKNAEVPARWDLAKKHRLCFRCLRFRKFNHSCKAKKCGVTGCKYVHHPMLHDTSPRKPTETSTDTEVKPASGIVTAAVERSSKSFLKILPVRVTGSTGACDTFALLDDGSTCTLIDSSVADKIGAIGPNEPFYIEGVAGARVDANQSRRVHFSISGHNSEEYEITAHTMEDLRLSPQSVSSSVIRNCPHLRDIENQLTFEDGVPTVLVGQDNFHLLLTHEIRRGKLTQPVASLTDLGWVLHGVRGNTFGSVQKCHHVNHTITDAEEKSMEAMMKEHFALESLNVKPKHSYTEDEQRALQILEKTTRRLPEGGYETGLLWRADNITPPDSYSTALRRLELIEKKLDRDEEMKKRYKRQLEVLFENGYAEEAPNERTERVWYLPHFAVINPQKPQKLRIVHDAAAKSRGTSLNDMLLPGPDLLQSLPGVLMRFRQRPIAVTADIKDMFMRVTMRERDRDMQRFLWRDERRCGTPKEYRMKSVIFGATSSPCTAIYVKNKNTEHFKEKYPEASSAIINNHYVDDYLASFETEEEAIRVSSQVMYIHSIANYFFQRWASNSKQVLSTLAPGTEKEVVHLDPEKILGMIWNPERDTLSFNVNEKRIPADILEGRRTPTKREALRTVMSIYDPLGIATPVTIQAKRIMQDTWRSGIDWDTELPENEAEAWARWIEHAKRLSQLAVPRCYKNLSRARTAEPHTFVDASSSAYAAATYWRVVDEESQVHVSLIAAKGRVAQINKVISIPRLELQAAVVGCRLARVAMEEHDLKPTRRVFWTDSKTVLAWLRTGPRAYKPFVAHRVAEIADETKTIEWRWTPTKENVADDATRDTPCDFNSEHRWYQGPHFLYSPEECWPQEDVTTPLTESTGEERTHVVIANTRLTEALPDITRFSKWLRVIRTTARVLQFIQKLRSAQRCTATYKRNKKNEDADSTWKRNKAPLTKKVAPPSGNRRQLQLVPIETYHLQRAQRLWVKAQQEELFFPEIAALRQAKPLPSNSRLSQLSVVLDDDDILRIRSRIAAAADLTTTQREPAIIDGNHPWTRLFIGWVHAQQHHAGYEATASEVRQHYWVLRLRYAVRSEIKRCQFCRIRRATPAQPSTGDHPRSRLAHHQRPFTYTGLDYFGPLTVTVGRAHHKRYGVLFTCLTTRAVHLELAASLSTDSAVMALRRFIGRRGCPTELWSDQGTNLRGADQELRAAAEEALQHEASVRFIQWRFIPPSAPFMGGAWERLVRSVKTALHVTLHERAPKEEVLATLLVEAEHTINSRPLTHLSTSPDDEGPLTPNHFLLGGPTRVPLPGVFTEGDVTGRKEWRNSQRLADAFWARWVREYLPELQHRREPRATRGKLQLNDLVLIADGTLPRNSWPRGVVIATYPGPDGEVRAVDVRTNKGVLRRPTKKLVILPTTPEDA